MKMRLKKISKPFFLVGIAIILFGVILIGCGLNCIFPSFSAKRRCTKKVTAVVESISITYYKGKYNRIYTTEGDYVPEYKFTYKGVELHVKGHHSSKEPSFKRGDTVTLYLNPKNFSDYYCSEEKNEFKLRYLLFFVLGAVGIFLGYKTMFCVSGNNSEEQFC
jgi:hypothetical protein